ncbi:ribonuclease 3-like [Bradysia coprophila]|uniref:ribonuclease 3-like n=1 Tax=Bradysia coprophila TaxID=38358 RepID=UPI00187DD43A|nr:ribonuclease 3-like [Bradysia coprophila]
MAITEYLFKSMDGANEGTLSIKRAKLVGRSKQTEIANQLQLSHYIDKSPGLQENFKRYDQFLEAIIGAVYADAGFGGQGLDAAKLVVYKLWKLQPTNTNVETNCTVM